MEGQLNPNRSRADAIAIMESMARYANDCLI
jgi:hypothetical protein